MVNAVCVCLIFDKVFWIIVQSHDDNKAILSKKQVLFEIWDPVNLESRLIVFALGEEEYSYSKLVIAGRERSKG